MARHKDTDWNLPEGRIDSWDQAGIAVLMDIRDELQSLNALLHCQRFVGIPTTLASIRRAMPAKRKAK